MITVAAPPNRTAIAALVVAAFQRSVGLTLAQSGSVAAAGDILVLIDPPNDWDTPLRAWLDGDRRKLIVLGRMTSGLRRMLGPVESVAVPDRAIADCAPATKGQPTESPGCVAYTARSRLLGGSPWRRPLRRYDFADEWNNLGFGAIAIGDGDWQCRGDLKVAPADELAVLEPTGASYAALFDRDDYSVLWFDRPAGPIDSFEWRLVENLLSSYRPSDRPTIPVLSEIPFGHDAAVTMRLDCDESLVGARPLMDAYRRWNVPLSLAVLTREIRDDADRELLLDALANGDSLLSHSATHPPQWGGSYDAARAEAAVSADSLATAAGHRPRYAASPFHNTPDYALRALADAGYDGCIGGRITDAPAFNLARGGRIDGLPPAFVGHSQQCMLHGDCLLDGADPIATYRQAFDNAYATRTLFGFLDHPFSPRYQYGWQGEPQRIAVHQALLDHIEATATHPLFLSEDAALDFLQRRQQTVIRRDGSDWLAVAPDSPPGAPAVAVEHRGEIVPARANRLL